MSPAATADYPRTFAEFIKRFDTEDKCLAYVELVRRSRGLLFYRLMEGAVATDPHPYRSLLTPQMRLPGTR